MIPRLPMGRNRKNGARACGERRCQTGEEIAGCEALQGQRRRTMRNEKGWQSLGHVRWHPRLLTQSLYRVSGRAIKPRTGNSLSRNRRTLKIERRARGPKLRRPVSGEGETGRSLAEKAPETKEFSRSPVEAAAWYWGRRAAALPLDEGYGDNRRLCRVNKTQSRHASDAWLKTMPCPQRRTCQSGGGFIASSQHSTNEVVPR